jgi:hypothetical protein
MSPPDRLPRTGAPATRALAGIGITRLSQLNETTRRANETPDNPLGDDGSEARSQTT